jgi:HEAT repeat protein
MRRSRQFLPALVAALCVLAVAAAALAEASEAGAEQPQKTAELLKVLETDGLTAVKAAAFEDLAVVGSAAAIPVLAPLLADKKLAHYARYALEPNPDPAVDRVFRDALKKLQGDLLIGVINSIGVRRDAGSLGSLEGLLADDSPEVVAAAAAALGSIATSEAADVLAKTVARAADETRTGIARGCLLCAENMKKAGRLDSAVALYDLVRAAEVPKNVQMAGLRGAILARSAAGVPLLVEQLASSDLDVVNVALRTARELDDPAVLKAIIARLDDLSETNAALVLLALGDIGTPSAAPILNKAAESGAPGLRLAAIKSLRKVGDVSAVAALWKGALGPDPRIADAAVAALVAIPGEETDAAIVAGLLGDNAAKRVLALELIASRRIPAAVPQLLQLAEGSDKSIRLLAIEALGETAPQEHFPTLIRWVIAAKESDEKATTARALQAACARLPDRDTCASELTGSLASATGTAETTLLEQLGAMGGPEALNCLAECAKDSSPETQDAATRILGTWIGSDVGPVLLDLARTIQNNKYKIRVLRGYIRIASQFGLPHDEKMEMCKNALTVAERDDERKLVLTVLERNPSPISLGLAVALLDNARLKNQAASVALSIAERLIEEEPKPVADAMRKVVDTGVDRNLEDRAKAYVDRVGAELE